jgi:putative NADH-flavin reductase
MTCGKQQMRLTIFAARGGIGTQLLEQAVAAGHDIAAVVRSPNKLSADVRIVTADLTAPDPAALRSAVQGADAVLSGLGPRGNSKFGIASSGTQPIVDAMRATDVRPYRRHQCRGHLDDPDGESPESP